MIVCLGTTPAIARTMEFASLAIDGVNRATAVREYAAGKAINAARAITTLGGRAVCISPVGGLAGERLRVLSSEVVAEQLTLDVAAATRLCVTVVDRAAGTSTELIEETGRLTPAEGDRMIALLTDRLNAAEVCVLAGSLAPGLAEDFYARCVALCTAAGVPTILDASGPALRAAIDARPTYIKVNAGELASVEAIRGDGEAAIVFAARAVAARTSGALIVTRGRESTLAVGTDWAMRIEVPTVKVVSAIGSGDSFAGGLAVAVSRRLSRDESLRLATACASANAMTADAAHFDASVVERLASNVQIGSIDFD